MEKKKISKEDLQKEKEEKQKKVDTDCSVKVQEFLKRFVSFTQKKPTNLLEEFTLIFKDLLSLWKLKIKNEKIQEELYLGTVDMVEFAIADKVLSLKFVDALDVEYQTNLLKFFYLTYERFTQKKNCKNLKPIKIYKLNHQIVDKNGIGTVNRSLFNLLKN